MRKQKSSFVEGTVDNLINIELWVTILFLTFVFLLLLLLLLN
jgi:hypothetical protein